VSHSAVATLACILLESSSLEEAQAREGCRKYDEAGEQQQHDEECEEESILEPMLGKEVRRGKSRALNWKSSEVVQAMREEFTNEFEISTALLKSDTLHMRFRMLLKVHAPLVGRFLEESRQRPREQRIQAAAAAASGTQHVELVAVMGPC
jgi:hypothetical protein